MSTYMQGEVMGSFMPGLFNPETLEMASKAMKAQSPSLRKAASQMTWKGGKRSNVLTTAGRAGSVFSNLKNKKLQGKAASALQQRVIHSAMFGEDDFLGKGKFLPGLFSAKLASKTLAKFDPTSKNAQYGKIVRAGIIGGASLIPVVGLGLSAGASAAFAIKAGADAAKSAARAQQQQVIDAAATPTPAAPSVTPDPQAGTQPPKSNLPLMLGIGGAGLVAALTLLH